MLILILLIALFTGLDLYAKYSTLKKLNTPIPDTLQGEKNKNFRVYQDYNKEYLHISLFLKIINAIFLVLFLYYRGYYYIDYFVRKLKLNDIFTGLVLFLTLIIINEITEIPLNYYKIFYIEEKYGFNKQNRKTFTTDTIKNLLIEIILSGILITVILYFFEKAGKYSPIIILGVISLLGLIMLIIYPKFIMPLFNKFEPIEEGALRDRIELFVKNQKLGNIKLYIMDGSKRSSKANAFFTGIGKTKMIALFDTLIDKLSEDEIIAVLAHEIGHYKKKHIVTSVIFNFGRMGIILTILQMNLNNAILYKIFEVENQSVYMSLLLISIPMIPISELFSVIGNYLSIRNEYEADKYAVDVSGTGEHLKTGLLKLTDDSLNIVFPSTLDVILNYSHPPIHERLKKLSFFRGTSQN